MSRCNCIRAHWIARGGALVWVSAGTSNKAERAWSFEGQSVELDAMTPQQIRRLLAEALQRHMSNADLATLLKQQDAEKAEIARLMEIGGRGR